MVLDAKRIQRLIEERADSTGLDVPEDFSFAEGVPPNMSASEADAQQSAVVATQNVRSVINMGGVPTTATPPSLTSCNSW